MSKVYTAKSECKIQLEYACSNCGTHNQVMHTVRAYSSADSSFTASVNANDTVKGIIMDMCRYNPANRFVHAGIRCKCASCRHREPWAKLTPRKIHIPAPLLVFLVLFAVMLLSEYHFLGYVYLALGGAFLLSIPLWSYRVKQLKQQILKLPPQSIPKVRLQQNDGRLVELCPPTEIPPDSWVCADCGEFNPNQCGVCNYCNATKSWSLSKQN